MNGRGGGGSGLSWAPWPQPGAARARAAAERLPAGLEGKQEWTGRPAKAGGAGPSGRRPEARRAGAGHDAPEEAEPPAAREMRGGQRSGVEGSARGGVGSDSRCGLGPGRGPSCGWGGVLGRPAALRGSERSECSKCAPGWSGGGRRGRSRRSVSKPPALLSGYRGLPGRRARRAGAGE